MNQYQYGDEFFAYQQIGSLASARVVVPLVLRNLHPASVLDVGCGAGAWMRAYLENGVSDVTGVDGACLARNHLMVERRRFRPVDVAALFRLPRDFDLVQCLEVAEHLPPGASDTLVANLTAHAPMVLFSAAPPGQGGEHHVNERAYGYWQRLFAERGYELFDFVRPRLDGRADVEPWYRYNTFLFVRADAVKGLPSEVAASHLPAGAPIPDVSPPAFRWRKRVLGALPVAVVTGLAAVKHRLVLRRRSRMAAS